MIPSILVKQLQLGLCDYVETTFPMTTKLFRGAMKRALETPNFALREPYVSVKLPFRESTAAGSDFFEAVQMTFPPYEHQRRAFERLTGDAPRSTVVATGTGSGKTECFLYPILDYCYRHKEENGVKAIFVYPMNALAEDQQRRVAKLVEENELLRNNVSVGIYVGDPGAGSHAFMDEKHVISDRATLRNTPPDILITNYKMLDFLLLRPGDADLWSNNAPDTLKFFVVDELHTFDGAQGTDLACLARRLKARLGTPDGTLCCVGTSATMGGEEDAEAVLKFASDVFGEKFEPDALVTEDRLSPQEFFADAKVSDFTVPTAEQVERLEALVRRDEDQEYLREAADAWLESPPDDLESDEARIRLGEILMEHDALRATIAAMNGRYVQLSQLAERLLPGAPRLAATRNPAAALEALVALVSHARIGAPGKTRPFLNVAVQFWARELRRLVASVTPDAPVFALASELNGKQAAKYLPVVNCRDCGATGWATVINAKGRAEIKSLETFYNLYFACDEKIQFFFPTEQGEPYPETMALAGLCPDDLQVSDRFDQPREGEPLKISCDACGQDAIPVLFAKNKRKEGSSNKKERGNYKCPFCGSTHGLALVGARSATLTSACLSQVFASRFNDDKKTLAFSDSVQDAAHRAGFFNARAWRFGFRGAVARYACDETSGGAGKTLADFRNGFVDYWRGKGDDDAKRMSDENFVAFFIAPNMVYRNEYKSLAQTGAFFNSENARRLVADVEQRLKYELLLEFGLSSRIGRALGKTGVCCLEYDPAILERIAERVVAVLWDDYRQSFEIERARFLVVSILDAMRRNGAFNDPFYRDFLANDGDTYRLARKYWFGRGELWTPGVSKRGTPRFLANEPSPKFDSIRRGKYEELIKKIAGGETVLAFLGQIILDELTQTPDEPDRPVSRIKPSSFGRVVFAIDPTKVRVSKDVAFLKCKTCGTEHFVARENLRFWEGAPCFRPTCPGVFERVEKSGTNYYGRLFTQGDLMRVNAREHTSLVGGETRAALEDAFKSPSRELQFWRPNVLSCTPTLEMGIDIGDLSTVFLCGTPPAQARYQQRAGRGGRRDGNSLTTTLATAQSRDMYFYAEPLEMIEGGVRPPKVFLDAVEVLKRQFVAFCMDNWVKDAEDADGLIPKSVGKVLATVADVEGNRVDYRAAGFPHNFFEYVRTQPLETLCDAFVALFKKDGVASSLRDEIRKFAQGDDKGASPMTLKILNAFLETLDQRNSLNGNIKILDAEIVELRAKPKDVSRDEEIAELAREREALKRVRDAIDAKNVFNFLCDESLLPNYAFPEEGVVLKAVVYRSEEPNLGVADGRKYPQNETQSAKRSRFPRDVYEYRRGAASALGEFAPNNTFYVEGRKLQIDQIDVGSAETESWRLCPNCSHTELEATNNASKSCPRCGDVGWGDVGQLREMKRVKMVYSNVDEVDSLISDDSDERATTFFFRRLLVDVDKNDVMLAHKIKAKGFDFGYDFVRKATLREINFGESDVAGGEKFSVCGEEAVRKGFRVCKYCGKLQETGPYAKPKHALYCKSRKALVDEKNLYEESLFLYRDFQTEALRVLIPATLSDAAGPSRRADSFIAAFMLGMTEYFGNVGHLRSTIGVSPVPDAGFRKQYLVIYDSVPGGTGYLEQLMNDEHSLIDILEKALAKLEDCVCKDDPVKDGCYRCLYAHSRQRKIGDISRATAIEMLRAILDGKETLETIRTLDDVDMTKIYESELEELFIEALRNMGSRERKIEIKPSYVDGHRGFVLRINESIVWTIQPQAELDPSCGVSVKCRPDFIFRPVGQKNKLPIAVFNDGFRFHRDKVADDTVKSEAIRRSERYRVWRFSWSDVMEELTEAENDATATLDPSKTPNYKYFNALVDKLGASSLKPVDLSAMELFMRYLQEENAESLFGALAKAYSWTLVNLAKSASPGDYADWKREYVKLSKEIAPDETIPEFGDAVFGEWRPGSVETNLTFYACVSKGKFTADHSEPVSVIATIDDDPKSRTDSYKRDWKGFWQYFNVLQFDPAFRAISTRGVANGEYYELKSAAPKENLSVDDFYDEMIREASAREDDRTSSLWREFDDSYATPEERDALDACKARGIEPPDGVGDPIVDAKGKVVLEPSFTWSKRRVAFMLDPTEKDVEIAQNFGWRLVDDPDEI